MGWAQKKEPTIEERFGHFLDQDMLTERGRATTRQFLREVLDDYAVRTSTDMTQQKGLLDTPEAEPLESAPSTSLLKQPPSTALLKQHPSMDLATKIALLKGTLISLGQFYIDQCQKMTAEEDTNGSNELRTEAEKMRYFGIGLADLAQDALMLQIDQSLGRY